LTTEAYLADKDLAGKCKASQEAENTSSDEEDKDKGAGEEAGETMPAAGPKTKKTPKAPMPKTAPPKPPTVAPTDEDDVDGLADEVQANLNLNAWYKIDHSQEFAIVACVFLNPKMQMRYDSI
jgi:hypothetical protein